MHPLVKAAMAVAAISAVGLFAPPKRPASLPPALAPVASSPTLVALPCGDRSIPEGDVCVPLPAPASARHVEARGAAPPRRTNEAIPRRPDRPEDPASIILPLPSDVPILFGFDIPKEADDEASRTNDLAVDLGADRGTEVKLAALEGQKGPAEVVAVGDLVGKTVVTLHNVEEGGRSRQYLVFYGRLDAAAPDVAIDSKLEAGEAVGFVGDSGTPGFVHLHLEVRLVRDDIDVRPLDMKRLLEQPVSIPVDARNAFARVASEAP
jgi:murein DD-endopeptidase MepM/ murein hydrolase activator NlpD